jgi:predicted DNA-binding transcriptional regulator YafY
MRASRLVTIVLLLQARGRATAQQLAGALEVSVRTVYRDMDALAEAGVPVVAEAGHDGGYRLIDGYRTRLTGLTADEAGSLFLAGLPDAAGELGLGDAAAGAQLKLLAALPEQLRGRAERTAARFHLDAPAWYRAAEETPHLAAVAGAVWQQRPVRLRYLRWAEPHEVTRTVRPYGLVLKAGRWYLVAAGEDGEPRTFRVSRILDAEVGAEPFDRRPAFDLAAYWTDHQRDFDRRRLRERAVLRMRPDTFAGLPERLEPAAARCARESVTGPDADGLLRVEIPVETADVAVPRLLGLGPDVEVLGPAPLRARMAAAVEALSARYRSAEVGPACAERPTTDDVMRSRHRAHDARL